MSLACVRVRTASGSVRGHLPLQPFGCARIPWAIARAGGQKNEGLYFEYEPLDVGGDSEPPPDETAPSGNVDEFSWVRAARKGAQEHERRRKVAGHRRYDDSKGSLKGERGRGGSQGRGGRSSAPLYRGGEPRRVTAAAAPGPAPAPDVVHDGGAGGVSESREAAAPSGGRATSRKRAATPSAVSPATPSRPGWLPSRPLRPNEAREQAEGIASARGAADSLGSGGDTSTPTRAGGVAASPKQVASRKHALMQRMRGGAANQEGSKAAGSSSAVRAGEEASEAGVAGAAVASGQPPIRSTETPANPGSSSSSSSSPSPGDAVPQPSTSGNTTASAPTLVQGTPTAAVAAAAPARATKASATDRHAAAMAAAAATALALKEAAQLRQSAAELDVRAAQVLQELLGEEAGPQGSDAAEDDPLDDPELEASWGVDPEVPMAASTAAPQPSTSTSSGALMAGSGPEGGEQAPPALPALEADAWVDLLDEGAVAALLAAADEADAAADAALAAARSGAEEEEGSSSETGTLAVPVPTAVTDPELAKLLAPDPELEALLAEEEGEDLLLHWDEGEGEGDDEQEEDEGLGEIDSLLGPDEWHALEEGWGGSDEAEGDSEGATVDELLEEIEADDALSEQQKMAARVSIKGMFNEVGATGPQGRRRSQPSTSGSTASKAGASSAARGATTTGWGRREQGLMGLMENGGEAPPPPLLSKPARPAGGSHQ